MQRLHVSLKVQDLDASIRFYSTLFGSEPTTLKEDYAKWMLDDPRVNFSMSPAKSCCGPEEAGLAHLGIEAETPEELAALRERVGRAGGLVEEEGETTCCYHHSDKTWVTDEQGVSWEAFYTSGEAETYYAPDGKGRKDGCCSPAGDSDEKSGEGSCCAA